MNILNIFNNYIYTDASVPYQLGFQDSASPMAEGIFDLHHQIFFFLIIILTVVSMYLFKIIFSFSYRKDILDLLSEANQYIYIPVLSPYIDKRLALRTREVPHNLFLEIIWTIVPAIVLLYMAIKSFSLLLVGQFIPEPALTFKAIAHQWYWTYEYSDYMLDNNNSILYDSYMLPEEILNPGQFRLLEVDNRIVLPTNTHIRILTTSTDVIHAWTVPSLGVKVDALPGRLNEMNIFITRPGVFYGQCSEICGVNHGFMPIVIEAISPKSFGEWIMDWFSKLISPNVDEIEHKVETIKEEKVEEKAENKNDSVINEYGNVTDTPVYIELHTERFPRLDFKIPVEEPKPHVNKLLEGMGALKPGISGHGNLSHAEWEFYQGDIHRNPNLIEPKPFDTLKGLRFSEHHTDHHHFSKLYEDSLKSRHIDLGSLKDVEPENKSEDK
uniref:Cytochrome c oxidase subunit 2 n=1 Tax=Malawimonas californiana TaxID=221722 RepID=A0A0B5GCN8_MALCL|nr:cytochrome c oxidase subunit 2 [Malawimonas californiana]AJF22856.1 cytochrome c oxidase subunit 2 [Malawimonas californiana]